MAESRLQSLFGIIDPFLLPIRKFKDKLIHADEIESSRGDSLSSQLQSLIKR